MEESFRVGATLALQSNIPEALLRFSQEFERFDRRVKESVDGLGAFTKAVSGLGRAGRGMERLATGMERISRAGSGLADIGRAGAALERLGADGKGISRVASAIKRLSQISLGMAAVSMDDYAQALGRIASHERAMRSVAESVNSLGRAGKAVGAASLAGGSPAVESELEARRRDREIRDGEMRYRHSRHHLDDMGQAGVSTGAAAAGGLAFMGRSVEAGMDVLHERAQILADQRVTPADADKAVDAAYAATMTPKGVPNGTKWSTNIKSLRDLKDITGDLPEAEEALPAFARLTAILQAVDRKKGGNGESAFAAAKAMEILGEMIDETVDPKTGVISRHLSAPRLNEKINNLASVYSATATRVDMQQYLTFAKTGAIPGMMFSDEFKFQKLPAMLMTLGGFKTGTIFQSLSQLVDGKHITNKSYDAMVKYGLAGPASYTMERDPKTGKMKKVRHNDEIYDVEDIHKDPLKYSEFLKKQLDAHGIHDTTAQLAIIQEIWQRGTVARGIAELVKDTPSVLNMQKNIQNQRPDLLDHYMKQDPSYALTQFDAAWEKFMATLGSDLMRPALWVLDQTTAGLNKLADWAKDNHTAAVLGAVAGGLFTLTAALGVLSMGLMIYMPAFKAAKSLLGTKAAASAAEGAGARSVLRLAPALGAAGAIASVGGLAVGALALGSEYETPQSRAALDAIAKARRQDVMMSVPQDGYGVGVPPPANRLNQGASSGPVPVHVTNDLTGMITQGQARRMNRPPDGPTAPNVNLSTGGAYFGSGWAPP